MKIVTIEKCNHCRYFDSNWGERCFHPKITKPHPDGFIPKELEGEGLDIEIPEWCPLDYRP